MIPSETGFNPLRSTATTASAASHDEASGTPASEPQGVFASGSAQGKDKGEERLKQLKRQDDNQRTQVLAQFYGKDKAGTVLAQQRALKAAAREHGEPSSANAHAEYSVTGERYSRDRLSNSEPGRHFLGRLDELETLFKGNSRPGKKEIQRICAGLTECAEIFGHKLGMTLQDVSASVLKENGLEGKDPASFTLTDGEYDAVCQKVQSLHKKGVGYWENIEAAMFAPPF